MEGLFRALPPLSPDYSGVSSLFPDMRALIVIHDGTGCLGNTMLDEPRQGTSEQMIYTTNIRENDVVMGTDEALLEKLKDFSAKQLAEVQKRDERLQKVGWKEY